MADERKILVRVYSILQSRFSSLCGQDSSNVDGIIYSDGSVFGGRDRLTLTLSNAENLNQKYWKSCLLLDVCCKPIAEDELNYFRNIPSNDNNLEDVDNPDIPMILLLRTNVLRNHGIKSGQHVWLEEAHPLALSKVVLKTKPGHKLDDKLLSKVSKYFREHNRVVRENDILELREKMNFEDKNVQDGSNTSLLDFDVLKCEPISQGVIDSQTNLILLKPSGECTEDGVPREIKQLGDSTSSGNLAMFNLLVAEFTTPLHGIWCDRPQVQNKTAKLIPQVDDWMELHQSFSDSGYLGNKHDIYSSSCIYVSLPTLVEIGIQNGSWVKIWVQHNASDKNVNILPGQRDYLPTHVVDHTIDGQGLAANNPNKMLTTYHYAQLYAIDPQGIILHDQDKSQHNPMFQSNFESINHIVHVSPLLHFNLINNSSNPQQDDDELIVSVIPYSNDKRNIRGPKDESSHPLLDSVPPYAKEAHISLVQTVFTKPGCIFDKILEIYFSKPRLLTVGYVFCIQLDGFKDVINSSPSDIDYHGLENRMIYFKVMKLVCAENEAVSCLADIDRTSVYQASAVHSFVPVIQHFSEDGNDRLNYWNRPTPPGLEMGTEELKSIIKPYLRQNVEMMPAVLITGPNGTGKRSIVMALGRQLGLLTMKINCYDLIGDSVAATEARISNVFQKVVLCRPCILLLRNIDVLAKDRDGLEDEPRISSTLQHSIKDLQELSTWPVVVIATSSSYNMSAQVRSCFLHEVKVHTPSEDERKRILEALASMSCVCQDVSFELVSKRTAGFVLADFVSLFTKATSAASRRISNYYSCLGNELSHCSSKIDRKLNTNDVECSKMDKLWQDVSRFGPTIVLQDLQDALEEIQGEHSDAIGAPKIPSVAWRDIGGLLDAKAELLDTIQLPLQHPELFASGLRRSGVLLYGPPGTGKTLLAKAVATECSLNFLSVKGPELINMYVGQSEENIRHVFTRAQSASPCVIFFDELDSLAPNRGRSGDSGGVMDRVVSQLLAELDGLHKSRDVFVIGATNRPDLLDPALLRPGRFDKLLYLGISEDHESQLKILKALTSKFKLDPDCDLESMSRHCPLNFTGADLYALCSDAMLHAIKRLIADQQYDDEEIEISVTVNEDDFLEALKSITPSVPANELQRYERIREKFTS